MNTRDNAWFIENAGRAEQFTEQAQALLAQAEVLREQARALESDARDLPKTMEIFNGQAITIERDVIHDGRVFINFGSLPRQRSAEIYQRAGEPERWTGRLEAFSSSNSTRIYDNRVYTGGFFLGFHLSEEQLIEIAKRWVAFGEIPQEDARRF